MDESRHQFLARADFTRDQHGRVRLGDFGDGPAQRLDPRADAKEPEGHVLEEDLAVPTFDLVHGSRLDS